MGYTLITKLYGIIPLLMVKYNLKIISNNNNKVLMTFKVSMDITIGLNRTNICDEMRSKHLCNWVNKYCINSSDKRIHKFLFIVKLWAQYYKINVSTNSTINGYGWIHIAMFVLAHYYKSKPQTEEELEYESMYCDINIPKEITVSKLFILFIEMIHSWICFDELKEDKPETIIRKGMNVINGKWINNSKRYTLFVLDPFHFNSNSNENNNNNLPGNLTKCVRNRKGIPLLINAIKLTVHQLQFAAHDSIQCNENAISKYISFFNTKPRTISDCNNSETKEESESDTDASEFDPR